MPDKTKNRLHLLHLKDTNGEGQMNPPGEGQYEIISEIILQTVAQVI